MEVKDKRSYPEVHKIIGHRKRTAVEGKQHRKCAEPEEKPSSDLTCHIPKWEICSHENSAKTEILCHREQSPFTRINVPYFFFLCWWELNKIKFIQIFAFVEHRL